MIHVFEVGEVDVDDVLAIVSALSYAFVFITTTGRYPLAWSASTIERIWAIMCEGETKPIDTAPSSRNFAAAETVSSRLMLRAGASHLLIWKFWQ
jgi:hypothetical protein